jgi:subtilase family serine protease
MFSVAAFRISGSIRQAGLTLATLALAASPLAMQAKVVSAVPNVVAKANSRGPIAPSADVRLTIWLAMPNRAEFDKKVADLYSPGSPSFHKWLSTEELLSYAPSSTAVKAVKDELTKRGLTVVEDGRDNFSIAVHGPAEKVEAAFGTKLEMFEHNGTLFHANTKEASLSGDLEKYVARVGGLSNVGMKPMHALAKNPKTGKPLPSVPYGKAKATGFYLSSYFTNKCFETPTTLTFGTSGVLPTGVYFGNVYDNSTLTCGWTPKQMQAAYGLPAVYSSGLKGDGQNIVLVDAYGSSTIGIDSYEFSMATGLPKFTNSTLHVKFPSGQPLDPALGPQLGWDVETTLDVEWAHAIAPNATITLLAAASQDDQDLQYAVEYATVNKLGSVISNSYGSPEIEDGGAALDSWNQVNEMAAAVGISVNYSSGDGGDEGLGTPVGAVSVPADTLYGTAVGGTSLGVPGGTGPALETGWGNNQTELAYDAADPLDPPFNFGNVGGAGGGESIYFKKPSWQTGKGIPGSGRGVPDVAMEADPYTGAIILFTDPVEGQVVESIGGTSLSCPMFSAYWALANEKAGKWLGQAAPIISKLPSSALNDILQSNSATNVAGTVVDSSGATFYSAADLAAPLEGTTTFTSAVWPIQGFYIDLTFGTDSSLSTNKGWDNVTGFGTPTGLPFITAAAK